MPSKKRYYNTSYAPSGTILCGVRRILEILESVLGNNNNPSPLHLRAEPMRGIIFTCRDKPHYRKNRRAWLKLLETMDVLVPKPKKKKL